MGPEWLRHAPEEPFEGADKRLAEALPRQVTDYIETMISSKVTAHFSRRYWAPNICVLPQHKEGLPCSREGLQA